jgi:hypothetical protein
VRVQVLEADVVHLRAARGVKQSVFCMAHRKTMITMGSPYVVWINANEIISSWYLLGAVCVNPPPPGGGRRRRHAQTTLCTRCGER